MSDDNRKIAVFDIETDPFEAGRYPMPFAVGVYTDKEYKEFWGDDCIEKCMDYLEQYPEPLLIYAHNGGKFDFSYCVEYIDNPISVIKSRLGKAKLFHHEIRDSYLIMPFSLAKYQKTPIVYRKFERHCRERHKKEILAYLYTDCRDLFVLVSAFVERFGRRLTIAKTAMIELRKLHSFETMKERDDEFFRQFYFGGRVQCFDGGIIRGPWKQYDINAQYPYVMANVDHPCNNTWDEYDTLPDTFNKPYFAIIDAINHGALPVKTDNGLSFTQREGTFYVCSHELQMAMLYKLVEVKKVHVVYVARQTIRFNSFVQKFYAEREIAKRNNDRITDLFGKYMLNAPYGKFGQNPRDYEDCRISFDEFDAFDLSSKGYSMVERWENYTIWARPATVHESGFFDVSIAASITSAARALLLAGLQNAVEPIYCDTDAIICRELKGDIIDPFKLGKFKIEKQTDYAAICGKKLYALFDGTPTRPRFKKITSKGGELTGKQILKIARGETVQYDNPVPTYSWRKTPSFIKRTFKKTIDENLKTG